MGTLCDNAVLVGFAVGYVIGCLTVWLIMIPKRGDK